MKPLIITVAGVGAELTKKHTPHLPITPDEIIASAMGVSQLGAQVFHLHVRDPKGEPTCDPKTLDQVIQGIRKKTPLIIQVSTGGDIHDTPDIRLGTLDASVDMGSLTLGSVNFGDEIFSNPRPLVKQLAQKMLQRKIRPELEIFEAGMVDESKYLINKGLIVPPFHFNIILGGPGWLAATVENLEFILKKLPAGSSWSAAGIGRFQKPLLEYAISHGGHVRTGLEDNIYASKGVLAKGNEELVEQVISSAQKYGRRLATFEETQQILGVNRTMSC